MEMIKEFKSEAKFPLTEIIIFVAIFGYIDYGVLISIPKFLSLINKVINPVTTLLMLIDISVVIIFLFIIALLVWFHIAMIQGLAGIMEMIGIKVVIFDKGIKIQKNRKEAYIPNPSITHISCSDDKKYLFIVWNGAIRTMTFVVSSKKFGSDAVKEMDLILSEKDAYISDPIQALEIRKSIKRFSDFHTLLFPFRSLCDIENGVEA